MSVPSLNPYVDSSEGPRFFLVAKMGVTGVTTTGSGFIADAGGGGWITSVRR
jgi:hypothetical protein